MVIKNDNTSKEFEERQKITELQIQAEEKRHQHKMKELLTERENLDIRYKNELNVIKTKSEALQRRF